MSNLFHKAVATTLPIVPKSIVRRVSSRYIAGESLDEALASIAVLNRKGFTATADILGEFVNEAGEAKAGAAEYVELLRALDREKSDGNISVKLTQLGLKLDPGLCRDLMTSLAQEAARLDRFVRIDMEDSTCTDATLDLYRALLQDHPNVGCVIQSYLKRSEADVRELAASRANVRLCKGIYVESPDIAFRDPDAINQSYESLLRMLLEGGSYVGIATHDEHLVRFAFDLIEELGLGPEAYEFQMLLGVTERLRDRILERGHRLRVYVPYGSHWYAYSVRRLKENPQIAGHVIKAFFNGG